MNCHSTLLTLHTILKLECPSQPDLLNGKQFQVCLSTIKRLPQDFLLNQDQTSYEFTFSKIFLAAKRIFKNRLVIKYTLPYNSLPDLLIMKDESLVPTKDSAQLLGPDVYKGNLAIVLIHRSHFADSNLLIYKTSYKNKMRYMKIMGLKTEPIGWMEFVDADVKFIENKLRIKLAEFISQ